MSNRNQIISTREINSQRGVPLTIHNGRTFIYNNSYTSARDNTITKYYTCNTTTGCTGRIKIRKLRINGEEGDGNDDDDEDLEEEIIDTMEHIGSCYSSQTNLYVRRATQLFFENAAHPNRTETLNQIYTNVRLSMH